MKSFNSLKITGLVSVQKPVCPILITKLDWNRFGRSVWAYVLQVKSIYFELKDILVRATKGKTFVFSLKSVSSKRTYLQYNIDNSTEFQRRLSIILSKDLKMS